MLSASDVVDMGNVNVERVMSKTRKLYDILFEILEVSKERNIQTTEIANHLAEERIEQVGKIKRKYVGK